MDEATGTPDEQGLEGEPEGDSPPTPEPGASTEAATDFAEQVEKMKGENAELRKKLRQEKAEKLAARHSLSGDVVPLLARLPYDEQDDYAKAMAAEGGATPGQPKSPEGEGTGEEPATQLPEEKEKALAGLASDAAATPARSKTPDETDQEQAQERLAAGDVLGSIETKARQAQRVREKRERGS